MRCKKLIYFTFCIATSVALIVAGTGCSKSAKDNEAGHDDLEGVIELDDEAQSMIQLKTESIRKRKLEEHLKIYGKISKDTENYSYVTFDGDGQVEKIYVSLGKIVEKGDPLLSIRKKDGTIEEVLSEGHGTILSIFVKPSGKVDSLTSLLSVINVDTMRAIIDIYEKDLGRIEVGQKAILTIASFPKKEFHGEVVYISPQVDEHTQSIKVRIDLANQDHLLRLGMFVSGKLIYESKEEVLAVPNKAVQQLDGEDIVFVQEQAGHFQRRDVVLGHYAGGFTEIKEGLNEGELVVVQGSFYLKSELAKESFGEGHGH